MLSDGLLRDRDSLITRQRGIDMYDNQKTSEDDITGCLILRKAKTCIIWA